MKEQIAKRYVKALCLKFDDKNLQEIYNNLNNFKVFFKYEKFVNIITSPQVSKNQKLEIFTNKKYSNEFNNFLQLLSQNDRFILIPQILKELDSYFSAQKNEYEGQVYSSFSIKKEEIQKIQESFSKKFNSKIILKPIKSDYAGIKISIDDLGVEVSFSLDRLKAQMSEHILKAI